MIRFIIILAILILALSFFGISIRNIVESPVGHDNFTFMWVLIKQGWDIFLGLLHSIVNLGRAIIPG
jgi:hypothetical protein